MQKISTQRPRQVATTRARQPFLASPPDPAAPARGRGAVTSRRRHRAPDVLFAGCFGIHPQDKSAVENQSVVPPRARLGFFTQHESSARSD